MTNIPIVSRLTPLKQVFTWGWQVIHAPSLAPQTPQSTPVGPKSRPPAALCARIPCRYAVPALAGAAGLGPLP